MGSDKRYNSLEHSAPEVVELQDAPEVVPSAGLPLARQESDLLPESYKRQRSDLLPETYDARPKWKQEHDAYGAYGTHSSAGDSALPIYTSHDNPGSDSYLNAEGGDGQHGRKQQQNERRYCGLRKAVLIWIIVGIILLIIIAVVLGAVLGTVLPEKKSGGKPLQAITMTGLATLKTSDGTVYQYFQNADRSIVENSYLGGSWSLDAGSENSDDNLVTRTAGAGSPFAAVSYTYNGDEHRQIFFITSTGELHTMNRTDSRSWGESTMITGDAASSGSIGLTACASDIGLDGIRVYYASQKNWIQEVAGYFNGSAWLQKHGFGGTDANSGVACSVQITGQHQYLLVYIRNPADSRLYQWYRDFATNDPKYYQGTLSWKNHTMAAGSDVAVCSDDADTNYVFYQLPGGLITRGVTNPSKVIYQAFSNIQGATVGSKLAAAYVEDGSMVLFQNKTSDSTMWAVDLSRDGYPIFNQAMS